MTLAFCLSRAKRRESSEVVPYMLPQEQFLAPQARAQLLPVSPVLACWDAMQRSAQKNRRRDSIHYSFTRFGSRHNCQGTALALAALPHFCIDHQVAVNPAS
jgi:hypothetical protein